MTAGTEELKETGFAEVHRGLGAKMVPFAGYWMPIQYESITAEHRAVRERAGLFDISHMGEFRVRGSGGTDFLDALTVNDVAALAPHQAQYSCMCLPEGGILDDVVVYRMEDGYMLVVNASNTTRDLAWLREHLRSDVSVEDVSEQTSLLALQGPRAEAILTPLTGVDLASLKYYWKADGEVAGIPAVVSRTGYTGEDGFELYFDRRRSEEMWERLMTAGRSEGLVPAGLGARDTLRLEMRYALYGNDIDEDTNPIEAGLGWIVKLDKGEFIGRGALRRVKEEGPSRRFVGFQVSGRGFPRPHYRVLLDGEPVTEVRSGTVSPSLGVGIGTCYLPAQASKTGTRIGVEVRGQVHEAEVVPAPFYKGGSVKR